MTTTQLQRFTDPDVLAGIGSELLGQFLDRFASALEAGRIERPDPSGRFYFKLLANQLRRGEALPGELLGALMEVERLAAPEQRERLMDGAAEYKLRIDLRAPLERTALQLWLAGGPKLAPSNGASEGGVSSPGLAGGPGQDWVVVPVGEAEKATGGGDAVCR